MAEQTTAEKVPPTASKRSGPDRALRRRRVVWVLAVLALLVTGIAAAFTIDLPARYFRLENVIPAGVLTWVAPVCCTAAVALFLVFVRRLWRCRTWLWVTVAAVLSMTLFLWPLAMLRTALESDDYRSVAAVAVSPDGRHEAVTEHYFAGFEPSCRVWLRERGGLLSRQARVWERIEWNCPASVSFTDDATISITDKRSREIVTTTFDADRMRIRQTTSTPSVP